MTALATTVCLQSLYGSLLRSRFHCQVPCIRFLDSVTIFLFSEVLSAIFWRMFEIFRDLLIPMCCAADLHFCLEIGLWRGFHCQISWLVRCLHLHLSQVLSPPTFSNVWTLIFVYIFLSRCKTSPHWHCVEHC